MTLLQMSLMGGLMVLAFALLRRFLAGYLPRRAFLWMWTAAVCRLLLPVRIPFGWSVFRLLEEHSISEKLDPAGTEPPLGEMIAIAGNGVDVQIVSQTPVLFIVWSVGVILVGGYFLLAWIYWRRRFSAADVVEADGWKENYPLRRSLTLRELAGVSVPLTYGIVRPVILLPLNLTAGEEQLRCILTHEYIHIRRLDALRKGVLALTLTIHWFNPAVWLLFRLAGRDIELLCDQLALERLGEAKRKIYAYTLLEAAQRRSDRIPLCSFFGKPMIEERILMMKEGKHITMLATVLAAVLLIGVTTAFATSAESDEPPYRGHAAAVDTEPAPVVAEPIEAGSGKLTWPAEGCDTVSCPFGKANPVTGVTADHITIAGEEGANILAAAAGTVIDSGWQNRWGNYLEIDHGNGLVTFYTHLQETCVSRDMAVEQGQVIGTLGKTGVATGPCLGFYLSENGETVDPMEWFEQ